MQQWEQMLEAQGEEHLTTELKVWILIHLSPGPSLKITAKTIPKANDYD